MKMEFKCKFCGYPFADGDLICRHYTDHHMEKLYDIAELEMTYDNFIIAFLKHMPELIDWIKE
jgi:hypothetical protein